METKMTLPQGMAYGNWDFPVSIIHDLTFEIEICGNVDQKPGRYYQLYDGSIAGVGSYFGLQTDLWKSSCGGQGHGLIFSRWKTSDPSDARVAPNGWIENSDEGGAFVGVRALVPFSEGKYLCTLSIVETDGCGVWYEFAVTDQRTKQKYSAGCLRFPSDQIPSGGGTWTEVYTVANKESDVPKTEFRVLSLTANRGALRPSKCKVCYGSFSKSDAHVENGVLSLRSGQGVIRLHEEAEYSLLYNHRIV